MIIMMIMMKSVSDLTLHHHQHNPQPITIVFVVTQSSNDVCMRTTSLSATPCSSCHCSPTMSLPSFRGFGTVGLDFPMGLFMGRRWTRHCSGQHRRKDQRRRRHTHLVCSGLQRKDPRRRRRKRLVCKHLHALHLSSAVGCTTLVCCCSKA